MDQELTIVQEASKYGRSKIGSTIQVYDIDEGNNLHLPFSYAKSLGKEISMRNKSEFQRRSYAFEAKLRDYQEIKKKEIVRNLNGRDSVILAAYPGWGKTCVAIKIASITKLKTIILIHRVELMDQWKKSIEKFTNATVSILNAKKPLEDTDFIIANPTNIPKKDRNEFLDIGLVIVDECHLIMAERMSESMMYLSPRYLLGLSATPYREDGLDGLFELYFGDVKLHVPLHHPHVYYPISTGFDLPYEMSKTGKMNWNSLLESQAFHPERNAFIIELTKKLVLRDVPRVVFIMCKRVDQVFELAEGISQFTTVARVTGKEKNWDRDAQVLVGTNSKAGVGFDHPSLDTLILAADLQAYFIQNLGRVMRKKNNKPLIFDLVDTNFVLQKHYSTRRKVYDETGGERGNFDRDFPSLSGLLSGVEIKSPEKPISFSL